MRHTLDRGKESYPPHFLTFLTGRLELCQTSLNRLLKGLDGLASELVPIHETLVSILRSTSAANTRSKVHHFRSRLWISGWKQFAN
jgi:hypothetical protein